MGDAPDVLVAALQRIARGRGYNGLPLNREDARETARRALLAAGLTWTKATQSPADQPAT